MINVPSRFMFSPWLNLILSKLCSCFVNRETTRWMVEEMDVDLAFYIYIYIYTLMYGWNERQAKREREKENGWTVLVLFLSLSLSLSLVDDWKMSWSGWSSSTERERGEERDECVYIIEVILLNSMSFGKKNKRTCQNIHEKKWIVRRTVHHLLSFSFSLSVSRDMSVSNIIKKRRYVLM